MNNSWQTSMYDKVFAEKTLNSKELNEKAVQEVKFLLKVTSLNPRARILDVPCGTGRHARILAEKGFEVTGIDINPECLEIARKNAVKGFNIQLGNMNNLSSEKDYDCTLNLFSSFGYFASDEENVAVMRQLVSTLKPGGKLVLNLISKSFLLSVFQPVFCIKKENLTIVNASKYDPATSYNETYITVKDDISGETALSFHRMRLYTPNEIVQLMKECGLKDIQVHGDYMGGNFNELKSSHPFYTGIRSQDA